MYKIVLSPRVNKELNKLKGPMRRNVDRALLKLQQNPYIIKFKFLKNRDLADFRIRIGSYRILYDVYEDKKIIYILRIGYRKDIYR